jgi:hypothetical protein
VRSSEVHEELKGVLKDEFLPESGLLGGVSLACVGRDWSFGSPLSSWSVALSGSRPPERDVKKPCIGTEKVVQLDNGSEFPTHSRMIGAENRSVVAHKLQRRRRILRGVKVARTKKRVGGRIFKGFKSPKAGFSTR